MQLAHSLKPIAPMMDLGAVEQLVTESLFGDWVIQIEHSSLADRVGGAWVPWGNGFFGARDVAGLINGLLTCRATHPSHAIRISAEKLRPQSRLVYWVFQPEQGAVAPTKSTLTVLPARIVEGQREVLQSNRARAWRYGAIGGLLAVAAFVYQNEAIARLF